MEFTQAQRRAIDIETEGTDVLVSAGAGSGKTAVLTERVLRKLREGVPLERLVILTFTNKAAAEMKARIRRRVIAAATQHPHLEAAADALDGAAIQTFDSYAYAFLKKYGHLRDLSPSLAIGDEAALADIREQLVDELFERRYASKDEAFREFVSTHAPHNDYKLRKMVLSLYDRLALEPDREDNLKNLDARMFEPGRFDAVFRDFEAFLLEEQALLMEKFEAFAQAAQDPDAIKLIDKARENLSALFQADDFATLREAADQEPSLPGLQGLGKKLKGSEEIERLKARRKDFKDALDVFLDRLDRGREEHERAYFATRGHVRVVKELVREFTDLYERRQHQEEIFEYSFVARTALEIVRTHPSIRDALFASLDEVLIDEYQDTNPMQEAFVHEIAKGKTYMVGDVKQSIYRFRNADPGIFAEKYRRFKQGGSGVAIDLRENFRSRPAVLDAVNKLFDSVMDQRIGGIDYDETQSLIPGNDIYQRFPGEGSPHGVDLVRYDPEASDAPRARFEATLLGEEIQRRVERGDEIVDGQETRPVDYGDFAILMSTSTAFETYVDVFNQLGVPLSVHKNPSFAIHDEVRVFRQLLQLLNALDDDDAYPRHIRHALMSVGRSFLLDVSDQQLIETVLGLPDKRPKTSRERAECFHGGPLEEFMKALEKPLSMLDSAPLDVIVFAAAEASDFYDALVRLPEIEPAKLRIDYLLELAVERTEAGETLGEFLASFDTLETRGEDREFFVERTFEPDKVHLLTMHKSKGLQFPYVLLPGLSKRFILSSMEDYEFDPSLGLILRHEEEGLTRNLLFDLKRVFDRRADVSEQLRLLYVAMTRAREGLFIPLAEPKEGLSASTCDETGRVPAHDRRQYTAFDEIFASVMDQFTVRRVDAGALDVPPESSQRTDTPFPGGPERTFQPFPPEPAEQHRQAASSSELAVFSEADYKRLETGERYHELFERVDLTQDPFEQIESMDDLDADEEQKLKAFFEHPIIQSLNVTRDYKELPFAFSSEEGVQSGYIDLLIETEAAFVIIDYKLAEIEKESYRRQIESYARALGPHVEKPIRGLLYSIGEERFLEVLKGGSS